MKNRIITIACLGILSFSLPNLAVTTYSAQVANVVKDIKENAEDDMITTKVKAKLLADSEIRSLKIHVKTKNNIVYLSGKIANSNLKDKIIETVKETENVKSVDASGLILE